MIQAFHRALQVSVHWEHWEHWEHVSEIQSIKELGKYMHVYVYMYMCIYLPK